MSDASFGATRGKRARFSRSPRDGKHRISDEEQYEQRKVGYHPPAAPEKSLPNLRQSRVFARRRSPAVLNAKSGRAANRPAANGEVCRNQSQSACRQERQELEETLPEVWRASSRAARRL